MGQIKWVLINIDNTQIDQKKNALIINAEMRRSINFLIDKGVYFTVVSSMHSNIIQKYVRDLFIPGKNFFIISSYGGEIYSFKKNKVINRSVLDNKGVKEVKKIIERINFDFNNKIFVVANEKTGQKYVWNNDYKYFDKKLDEFQRKNQEELEVIEDINAYCNILNFTVTFFEEVIMNNLIIFLTNLNRNFSYKIVSDDTIIITPVDVGTGISMDYINEKFYKINKESIMSFSDARTDLPLFNKSSIAITIDSASDDLKKAATNVFIGVENLYITEFLKKEITKLS